MTSQPSASTPMAATGRRIPIQPSPATDRQKWIDRMATTADVLVETRHLRVPRCSTRPGLHFTRTVRPSSRNASTPTGPIPISSMTR
jgi:hypothetical protein